MSKALEDKVIKYIHENQKKDGIFASDIAEGLDLGYVKIIRIMAKLKKKGILSNPEDMARQFERHRTLQEVEKLINKRIEDIIIMHVGEHKDDMRGIMIPYIIYTIYINIRELAELSKAIKEKMK